MEPDKPATLSEHREVATDNVKGPVHQVVSEDGLQMWDLANFNKIGFYRTINAACVLRPDQGCHSFPIVRVLYRSIGRQLCQKFVHIFQGIVLLKLLKDTVDLVAVNTGLWAQRQLCQLRRSEQCQRLSLRKGIILTPVSRD